ncbi:MAG: T9SS type A sorting domain-containing protein [Bacteroidetes bacterium]|nr:T9SS type A sorting domain-containing protein [Bacteroidota bacterium]
MILTHPDNDTVITGSISTFSITDTGGVSNYQWEENTGTGFNPLTNTPPYSGVNTKILTINPVTVTMNNYEYRCIRTGDGCVDTSTSSKLIIKSGTGLSEINRTNLLISPNPTNDNIQIISSDFINKVEIFNILGQLISSYNCHEKLLNVSIKEQVRGVYIIKVNDISVVKIVKE